MALLPGKNGNGTGAADPGIPRVGHVYLDLRHRVLHFLNVRAKQLHREGVPFLPSDLERCPVQMLGGEPVKSEDLPLIRAWKEERPEETIFLMARDGGLPQHITWNTAPMRNRKGVLVGVFGSVSLSQPEPDWQSLAGLTHDLRTPLQALRLLVEMLDDHEVDSDLRVVLQRIRTASDRALSIGLDLLEWCRGPVQGGRSAQPVWFLLEPFLFSVINEQAAAAEQKSLRLVTHLGEIHGWQICADQVRLGRLLSNLLVNAIRYTPAGSVQFRADWQEEGEVRKLVLGVVDTGTGISSEEQESIFGHFHRGRAGKDSDSGGSGLGLAVVEKLVEELGLELEVYSEYGRGSAFHLLVPARLLRPPNSDGETLDHSPATQDG